MAKCKPLRDQRGITLLLSAFLLAAITSIAFSLAVVGFAEIETSNDLSRTEPILYYSLGVAEEGTFGMKRGVTAVKDALGVQCGGFINYVIDATSPISTKTKFCNINSANDIEIAVPPNTYNTAVRLYIYNPATGGVGNSGYDSISFQQMTSNGGSVRMYMCQLDIDCKDPTPPSSQIIGWNPAGDLLDATVKLYPLTNSGSAPACCSYEVALVNSGTGKEFINVITEPKGLPYLNKQAIEIQSSYGRLIRRLRVLVPTQ